MSTGRLFLNKFSCELILNFTSVIKLNVGFTQKKLNISSQNVIHIQDLCNLHNFFFIFLLFVKEKYICFLNLFIVVKSLIEGKHNNYLINFMTYLSNLEILILNNIPWKYRYFKELTNFREKLFI